MDHNASQEPISYDIVHEWKRLQIQVRGVKPPRCYQFQRGCVFLDHFIIVDYRTVYTFHLKELYWSKFDLANEDNPQNFVNDLYLVKPGLIVSFSLQINFGPPFRRPEEKFTYINFLAFEIEEGVPKNFSARTKAYERSKLPESLGMGIVVPNEDALYLFRPQKSLVHFDAFTHINLETGEISKKKIEGDYPCQRKYCQTVLNNGKLYLFGGQMDLENKLFDLWVLHPNEMRWEKLNNLTASKDVRCHHNLMCMNNDEIFLYFREEKSDPRAFFSYNLKDNSWSEVFFPKNDSKFFYFMCADNDLITVLSEDATFHSLENPRKVKEARKEEIKKHIAVLCEGKTDPDVIFKVEDQEFPANKCFLSYRCPYFKKVFSSI